MAVALWETEADAKAGGTSGFYQQQIVKGKDMFAGPPVREVYEVSIQT